MSAKPMFLNPEAAVHSAIMQPDMTETMACNGLIGLFSLQSFPLEMVLRPRYGSRYFKIVLVVLAILLFPGVCILSTPFGPKSSMAALVVFWGLFIYHTFRQRPFYSRPKETEIDSELDNPGWSFLSHGSWLWTRAVWEPLFALTVIVILYGLGLSWPLALFLIIACFALSFKCFLLWYLAWLWRRTRLDMQNRMPVMEEIATGTTSKDVMPQVMRHKVTAA